MPEGRTEYLPEKRYAAGRLDSFEGTAQPGLSERMRHAEENNQKEKRHERNFNETVT